MGPSVIVTSSKELDFREQHGLLLKSSSGIPESCPTPVLFSVVAEQPIPKEVSGFIEFLSLVIHTRKALKDDGNGWTLSSRGELNGSLPCIQRSAPYILKGKILLGCLPFFPGRKPHLVLAWRKTIWGLASFPVYKQTALNSKALLPNLSRLEPKGQSLERWEIHVLHYLRKYLIFIHNINLLQNRWSLAVYL